MTYSLTGFEIGAWSGWLDSPTVAGMNLNHWADEAWANGSWVPSSWGTTPIVVTMDTHDGNLDYRKRAKQHAELRAMIEVAVNGRPATPVMAEVAKVIAPYRTPEKVDLTEVKQEVIARLTRLHAEYERQLESDDEEAIMLVMH